MFDELKVLVVGDICLDILEEGNANRLSPEAPVPVILNPTRKYSLGMMGNVMLNLRNLGADVEFITQFYGDKYGEKVSEILMAEGLFKVETNPIDGPVQTTVKKRVFANGQQVARIDKERRIPILLELIEKKLSRFAESGKKFDAIVISDYNKSVVTENLMELVKNYLPLIAKDDVKFYVDTKKKHILDLYMGRNFTIFPNTDELLGILDANNIDIPQLVARMNIVQTMSKDGALYHSMNGGYSCIGSPALKSEVIDVCGAGDTFLAAFALYDAKFNNKQRALDFANYCCSKVVVKKGTTPVEYQEVMDFERRK